MNETALFLATGVGTVAGILYGQQMSEQVLKRIVGKTDRRIRELRCVFCCGRIGSLLTALPTFLLAFFLPHRFDAELATLSGLMQPTVVLGVGLLAASLLAASLPLGAALGAVTGKGIAGITRDTQHPANGPA